MNEDNNDKEEVPDEFFFIVLLCPFVLLSNSMSKLIYNRCTRGFIMKTTAAYVHAHEQSRLCFYV